MDSRPVGRRSEVIASTVSNPSESRNILVVLRPHLFSPIGMLVGGALFWLLIRLSISFIWFGRELEDGALNLIASYLTAFLGGIFLIPKWAADGMAPVEAERSSTDKAAFQWALIILVVLSLLFVTLRMVDLIVNRDFLEYGGDVQLARIKDNSVATGRTTGGLSLISGMGYPIAVPTIVMAVLFRSILEKWQFNAAVGSFAYYVLFVALSGNRFILIGPIFLLIVAIVLANGKIVITFKKAAVVAGVILALWAFVTIGTRERDRLFGTTSAVETMVVMPNRLQYGATPEFIDWMAEQPQIVQEAALGYASLAWYVCHGLYELQVLADYADPSIKANGVAQYAIAFYFFRTIGLTDMDDRGWRTQIKNNGFYTSFFGPVYLDFGYWGGVVYMGFFGALCQFIWLGVKRRNLFCLLFFPYLANVIFSFPSNNLLQAGLGVIIMANITFAALLVGYLRKRFHKKALPQGSPSLI